MMLSLCEQKVRRFTTPAADGILTSSPESPVANVGHSHPTVVKAIKDQAKRYMHVSNSYYNDVSPKLAEKLAKIAPRGLTKSFFASSGAEAVEGAVKLAKKYAGSLGRSGMTLISYQGSFHGRLALSLTLTGQKKYKHGLGNFACYPGVVYAPAPYYFRYGDDLGVEEFGKKCADDLADLIDTFVPEEVAALIIEPIMGEGGIIVPPDNYLPAVQRICRELEITFIVDEVQTGIARTGKMFASEHWGLEPDIMLLAKGLGGGLPLAAIIAREKLAAAFEPGDHFSTFGGNPVCCAAGIAALEVVEKEGLALRSARSGDYMARRLQEIAAKHDGIGEVRGRGLMIGVELVKDENNKSPAHDESVAVKAELMRRGFLVGLGGIHKNVLRIQPPLVITEKELDSAAEAIDKSISTAFR